MPATHQRDLLQKLKILLYFTEFSILIFILICRPPPALQPHHSHSNSHHPGEKESHQTPGSCPGSFKDKKKDSTATSCTTLYRLIIPGYQNFIRMPAAFFDPIEDHIHPDIKKSVTNFRKPLEVGMKLSITLRHLATGETYTSLQYHWLVG